jgi:hypothetical protein
MDIEDVDITFTEGYRCIVAVHRKCGAVVERFSLSEALATIVSAVEASDHGCEPS